MAHVGTLVVFEDLTENSAVTFIYGPEDRAQIEENWEKSDTLLDGLQGSVSFAGRTRWCDLTPAHFRFLIARNFDLMTALPVEERRKIDNPVVSSLSFLVLSYAFNLEGNTGSDIEYMRIMRLGALNCQFLYTATVEAGFSGLFPPDEEPAMKKPATPAAPKKPSFRMVVDNERDD